MPSVAGRIRPLLFFASTEPGLYTFFFRRASQGLEVGFFRGRQSGFALYNVVAGGPMGSVDGAVESGRDSSPEYSVGYRVFRGMRRQNGQEVERCWSWSRETERAMAYPLVLVGVGCGDELPG